MTLAIGISNPEGAVLVTDSMVLSPDPNRSQGFEASLRCKLIDIPGGIGVAYPVLPPTISASGGFTQTVAAAFLLVSTMYQVATTRPSGTPGDLYDERVFCPQFMAIGMDSGRARMAWAVRGRALRVAQPKGAVFIGGGAIGWDDDLRLSPPATLDAAVQMACDLAGRFVTRHYAHDGHRRLEDYLPWGVVPPFALPLHVATLTNGGVLQTFQAHQEA